MLSFLGIAVLIGMSHALEADHVAAVSAMASKQKSFSAIVRTGAVWGLGHTATLMAFAGGALGLGLAINEQLAGGLEFGVGLMLMGLGGYILWRLVQDRIHFHMHKHGQDVTHFHAHSHKTEPLAHDHDHTPFPFKSLVVGMMHGMAGSAVLLMLTASSAPSPALGMAYVALFGFGSILGMAALSAIIAVPLAFTARYLTWANWGLQAATGTATLFIGAHTVYALQTLI